jgi:hypothetical protein
MTPCHSSFPLHCPCSSSTQHFLGNFHLFLKEMDQLLPDLDSLWLLKEYVKVKLLALALSVSLVEPSTLFTH